VGPGDHVGTVLRSQRADGCRVGRIAGLGGDDDGLGEKRRTLGDGGELL